MIHEPIEDRFGFHYKTERNLSLPYQTCFTIDLYCSFRVSSYLATVKCVEYQIANGVIRLTGRAICFNAFSVSEKKE